MLNLETKLVVNKATMKSPNLAGEFSPDDLKALGAWVWDGYARDLQSRFAWEQRTQAAMDLALQLQKDKSFPWPGASNVAFPLITIATLQFHSRAYPAIVSGPDLVKCRVPGPDPTGQLKAKALRVGKHMSYQALEQDTSWEEQHDRLLINLPIVGCAFKKTYHATRNGGVNKSELVLAKDFVLDYYAKSVEDCARKTHVIPLYRNEMHERMVTGVFVDYTGEAWYQGAARPMVTPQDARDDKRQGAQAPQGDETTPFSTLEQHVWVDLDKDGYAEPYIITIEATGKKILRIVARWDRETDVSRTSAGRIYSIRATEYFTKYSFIPAPDGSIYDLGFGILLGSLNESVSTLVNQLIDAGTMATTAGGFLGRGAKMRGGSYTFAPLEWKRVDATGDDLRKSIFPLPVREPSMVLFQLLNLLVNYTERISGSTDIMVGENIGQNTPKGTADQLVEQGSKIYSAIFKRVWRAMKEEFKKCYLLNAVYLPDRQTFGEDASQALREDYLGDPNLVAPSCDPNITSDQARMQQAIALKQAAMVTPGYNLQAVEINYLQALKVEGIEVLFPGPDKVKPLPNPKMMVEELKFKAKQMVLEQNKTEFLISMMEQQRVNTAKILELEAKAQKEMAEAQGVGEGHKIAAYEAAIGALKAHDDALRGRIEVMMKSMEQGNEQPPSGGAGVPGMAPPSGNAGPQAGPPGMGGGA
jgi:chaperonin GroES